MALPSDYTDREFKAFKENATDGGVDRRTCDIDANTKLAAILAALGGSSGTPFFRQVQSTTDGTVQELINETVGVGKTLTLKSVTVTSTRSVKYEVLEDSTVIGSGRVGAGNKNDDFIWHVDKILSAGTVLKVNVEGAGPNSDVEVYLQALEN